MNQAAVLGASPRSRTKPIDWRLWLLNLALGVVAAFAASTAINVGPKVTQFALHWWVLAALFFFAEVYVVQLRYRDRTHPVSLSEFPLVLGLFFSTPLGLLAGQLVGTTLALICRRQRPARIGLTIVQNPAGASLAILLFHSLTHAHLGSIPLLWLGAPLGACASAVYCASVSNLATAVSDRSLQLRHLPHVLVVALAVSLANSTLGLMGIIILHSDWPAVWLLLVPAIVLLVAYRAYAAERQKHARIQFLYESGRVMQQSSDSEAAILALLGHAAEMFHADVAELVLFGRTEQEQSLRTTLRSGTTIELMQPIEGPVVARLAAAIGNEPEPLLVPNPRADERLGYFVSRGLDNVMLAPLRTEVRVVGIILVGNRAAETGRFEAEDLRLLDTLATHASASIENARLEAKLKHQAFHDTLTQLANRALFTDRVEHALARRATETKLLAVMFMDLDDFKTVNDSLGHIAGDQLLMAVAERLRACLRPEDTAARLGGDEFAILLEDVTEIQDATRVAERIVEAFRSPFIVQREEVIIHASIGIAATGSVNARADDLLRQADEAMYTAKAQGKGRYQVFEPSMHVAVVERHELKADLQRRDFGTQTFAVHYQPIVRLDNGEIVGVEALLRWQHPRRGLVSPNDFIAIAEETGLILPLGKWVLQKSARQVRRWQEKFPEHARLAVCVNLSARQLQHTGLLEDILETLAQSDLEPNQLMLEITESVMIHDIDASVARLRQLKQIGVRLAIDDFGTGYSSLGILQQVPADTLKIAKQFVDGIGHDETREDFASAIIKLGQTVHMDVVAEGIESVRQAERLAQLGCHYGQGFLFSPPLTAPEIDEQLRRAVSFGTAFSEVGVQPAAAPVIALPSLKRHESNVG